MRARQSPGGPRPQELLIAAWASIALLMAVGANVLVWTLGTRVGPYWLRLFLRPRPPGIVIHHSAVDLRGTPAEVLQAIDRAHARRGWGIYFNGRVYHIGYHYLVLRDGQIVAARPEVLPGAHTAEHNSCLGVCVVGNFTRDARGHLRTPTEAQLEATVRLLRRLMKRYHLTVKQVYLHRDLAPTRCPGEGFPWHEVVKGLQQPAAPRQ